MKNTKWLLPLSLASSIALSLLPGWSSATHPSLKGARSLSISQHSAVTASKLSGIASQQSAVDSFNHRQVSFEPNIGQIDSNVKFLSRGDAYAVSLTQTGSVLTLAQADALPTSELRSVSVSRVPRPKARKFTSLSMSLAGANPAADIKGEEVLQTQTNYLFGSNRKNWRTGIPAYAKVRYQNIYPGIDMVYYGNEQQLEYDFVIAPGADPSRISMQFDGAANLRLDDKTGDLLITTADGSELRHMHPAVYQQIGGKRKEVAGRYQILADKRVSFHLGAHDSAHSLVIDPTVAFTTFLQGNKEDWVAGVGVDPSGNSYITGYTFSTNLTPTYNVDSFLKTCTTVPGTRTTSCPPGFCSQAGSGRPTGLHQLFRW